MGEDDIGAVIDDRNKLILLRETNESGIYLKNSDVLYDIRVSKNKSLLCNAYFDSSPNIVREFLIYMASVFPIFGFACTPEEKEARNRVTTIQGVNTIESWVGLDTQKYIPGLYWLTLLPAALAEQHSVQLSVIEAAALEHIKLDGAQYLLRFYDEPEDWRSTRAVAELCASLPGVFDIEKVRLHLAGAKNFLDLTEMIRKWQ
jgi:hypothetical protein